MKMELKNDVLDLIYKMNHKAEIVVKMPLGDCNPIFVENIVRQGSWWACFEQLFHGQSLS